MTQPGMEGETLGFRSLSDLCSIPLTCSKHVTMDNLTSQSLSFLICKVGQVTPQGTVVRINR